MKLHEALAIEGQRKGQAEKVRTEMKHTFDKKRHLYEQKRRIFHPLAEDGKEEIEEQSDIQSTIPKELAWIAGILGGAIDVSYQVAEMNMTARADVVLDDGTVLLTGVPATALLELEKRAGELQELIDKIPNLDPAKGFRLDPQIGKHVFVAREVKKQRTKKVQRPIILHPPTTEHPAQVQLVSEDIPVGTVTEQEWSGLISTNRKAVLLERVEELRRAFKTARSRANDIVADTIPTVGGKIFAYLLKESPDDEG